MNDRPLDAFLRGDRPDDVVLYLADGFVDDLDRLADHGERVSDGLVIVVDGDRGRNAFRAATGRDAMTFAGRAMRTEGAIDPDLAGGTCPSCGSEDVAFVFAFAEAQNEDAGGLYAEGDVIHAYAGCSCDAAFSERWVAGDD